MSFDSVCGAVLVFLSVSCSVKEDRSSCPSVVEIVACARENFGGEGVIVVYDGNGQEIASDRGSDRCLVEMSNKGEDIYVWYGRGTDKGILLGGYDDKMFSELYCGRKFVSGDAGVDTVMLHKDYSHLVVRMKYDVDFGFMKNDYQVMITGNVMGYGPFGEMLPGEFSVEGPLDRISGYSANVPRQEDETLNLRIVSPEGLTGNFSLGSYLASCGFDWAAEDLPDAEIVIDYESSLMTISTELWFRTISFRVVF